MTLQLPIFLSLVSLLVWLVKRNEHCAAYYASLPPADFYVSWRRGRDYFVGSAEYPLRTVGEAVRRSKESQWVYICDSLPPFICRRLSCPTLYARHNDIWGANDHHPSQAVSAMKRKEPHE